MSDILSRARPSPAVVATPQASRPKKLPMPEDKLFYIPNIGMNPILSPNTPSAAAMGGSAVFNETQNAQTGGTARPRFSPDSLSLLS